VEQRGQRGAIDQVDPITANPCTTEPITDGRWKFELPLPAKARELPILGDNAALLITITDRDQLTAENHGRALA
jgi:hypothetical protein